MSMRKNHTLDALSELHDLVESFPADVEQSLFDEDDGESHTKREAREVVCHHIDQMVRELQEFKATMEKKYR
jgi:hypothetical protein